MNVGIILLSLCVVNICEVQRFQILWIARNMPYTMACEQRAKQYFADITMRRP